MKSWRLDAADDENDQGNGEGEKLMKTSESPVP